MVPLAINLAIIFGRSSHLLICSHHSDHRNQTHRGKYHRARRALSPLHPVSSLQAIPSRSLLFALLLSRRKYAQEMTFAQGELLRPEREFMLTNYNIMKSSLNDYAEIAINFGFIALFVTALPIAAFAGFVSSLLEVKADAWKLMLIYQRPIPRGAEDIGMWSVSRPPLSSLSLSLCSSTKGNKSSQSSPRSPVSLTQPCLSSQWMS